MTVVTLIVAAMMIATTMSPQPGSQLWPHSCNSNAQGDSDSNQLHDLMYYEPRLSQSGIHGDCNHNHITTCWVACLLDLILFGFRTVAHYMSNIILACATGVFFLLGHANWLPMCRPRLVLNNASLKSSPLTLCTIIRFTSWCAFFWRSIRQPCCCSSWWPIVVCSFSQSYISRVCPHRSGSHFPPCCRSC